MAEEMSEEAKVIEVLRQNPEGISMTRLAKSCGMSRAKLQRILKELEDREKVEKIVKGRRTSYRLKEA